MGYASRSGRAKTSSSSPKAFAVCDRCGMWYNHYRLRWQMDWAGASLVNKRLLVCDTCYDEPQQQLRAIVIPADPVPVINPRIQDFVTAETNNRFTSGQNSIDPTTNIPIVGGNNRITENGDNRVTQETGEPPGGLNEQPGTDPTIPPAAGGTDPGLPYGFDEVPETGPLNGE
jgi:hypothetical protein